MKTLSLLLLLAALQANGQHISALTVFEQINEYRESKGLPALSYDSTLQDGVDQWAKHVSVEFEHADDSRYYENLAQHYNPNEIVQMWIESPPHNETLLEITSAAISIYRVNEDEYYAVLRAKE